MSLACFECDRIGEFNTLVIFDKTKAFNINTPISHFPNFYTDCASFDGLKTAKNKSRFMVVLEGTVSSTWNTGTDGDMLRAARYKYVDEKDLKKQLPKIFEALSRRG